MKIDFLISSTTNFTVFERWQYFLKYQYFVKHVVLVFVTLPVASEILVEKGFRNKKNKKWVLLLETWSMKTNGCSSFVHQYLNLKIMETERIVVLLASSIDLLRTSWSVSRLFWSRTDYLEWLNVSTWNWSKALSKFYFLQIAENFRIRCQRSSKSRGKLIVVFKKDKIRNENPKEWRSVEITKKSLMIWFFPVVFLLFTIGIELDIRSASSAISFLWLSSMSWFGVKFFVSSDF